MPTFSARSTARQRVALRQVKLDLQEAFDSLPGRFWSTRSQRDAYAVVLDHLAAWGSWERYDDEDDLAAKEKP